MEKISNTQHRVQNFFLKTVRYRCAQALERVCRPMDGVQTETAGG